MLKWDLKTEMHLFDGPHLFTVLENVFTLKALWLNLGTIKQCISLYSPVKLSSEANLLYIHVIQDLVCASLSIITTISNTVTSIQVQIKSTYSLGMLFICQHFQCRALFD